MRIAVVTDSHLAPRAAAFNDNWRAVRAFVTAEAPDLTIHLGDITVDGVKDPAEFQHARGVSADWPTPIRFLPGNHDIGDNPPGPGVAATEPLRPARLAEYRTAFGSDRWALDAAGWGLIGLDAQLLGTETGDEAEQWSWLAATLAGAPARPGRPCCFSTNPCSRTHPPMNGPTSATSRPRRGAGCSSSSPPSTCARS
jgi:3',5'-cyclic AMP phosphodiesterase CpdA